MSEELTRVTGRKRYWKRIDYEKVLEKLIKEMAGTEVEIEWWDRLIRLT